MATTPVLEGGVNGRDKKLFDSELRVMVVFWRDGEVPAKHIVELLREELGWDVNTVYTLIYRCIKKGVIEGSDCRFVGAARELSVEGMEKLKQIVEELGRGK